MTHANLITSSALTVALTFVAGCGIDRNSLLAPSDAVVQVTSSTAFVPINETATITVSVTHLDGTSVSDGTEVHVSASLGTLGQQKVRVSAGKATVTYRAGAQVGVEKIHALSGSANGTLELPISSGAIARVLLASDPGVLPPDGGSVELTVWAFTRDDQPVAGVPVTFQTTAGSITPSAPVITNAEGVARARLQASQSATVRASALEFATYEIQIPLRKPVDLILVANPTNPASGQMVTFTLTARLDGAPVRGLARIEFGNGQSADLGQINGVGTATQAFGEGSYNVSGYFLEADAIESRSTVRVEVSKGGGPGPGPGPTPAAGDAIDPRSIIWLSPASTDVGGWAITSTVTSAEVRGDNICINHTKAGQWPLVSIDENPPNIEGNPMIVVNIGGQWYGAGFDWFGEGRTCKHMPAGEIGRDQVRVAPLDASWPGPRSGDMVGLLVSTPSSNRIPVRSLNERTNIVLVRWP